MMETKIEGNQSVPRPLGVSGLGGWLILVQIGLYGTLLLATVQLFTYSIPTFTSETWPLLTSKESEFYHPLWSPLITFETIYNVLLIAFCIYILINFYSKKRLLPTLMIVFYAASLIVSFIDYLVLLMIPLAREMEDGSSMRDLIRSALTCAIWIPYFIKSERVQNTFVR